MKVTAILPDKMIEDVKQFTGGKNTTDSLIKALNDWLYTKRIEQLNNEITKTPVEFIEGFTGEKVRAMSNKITQ